LATGAQDNITTKVTVTGRKQTKPRNGGKLKIQAALNGKVLAASAGFSVCAHPLNFKDEFDSNIDEDLQLNDTFKGQRAIGMNSRDSWESDSGTPALKGTLMDLNKVQIKELLAFQRAKEPPFHFVKPNQSDYNLGVAFSTDRHTVLFPDPGPKADWTLSQLSIYKCERCGCRDVVMPNSGLKIIFRVVNDNGWKFFVEKVGAQVMVNSFTSGPADAKIKTEPISLEQK
jgi:hypothetical protein